MNVAHNSHDVQQAHVSIHVAELNCLPYRVSIRPILLCHRFADDSRMWRVGLVASIEGSSAQQRDTHRRKIARRSYAKISGATFGRVVVDEKGAVGAISPQG